MSKKIPSSDDIFLPTMMHLINLEESVMVGYETGAHNRDKQNPKKQVSVKLASDIFTSWPSKRTYSSSTCILTFEKENKLVHTNMKIINTMCRKKKW